MAKSTQKKSDDLARAYADRLVLSGITRVESTLRLGDLAAQIASHGISLGGLRSLLATNAKRFTYNDRRWMPAARVIAGEGPINEFIRTTLENFGAPIPVSDLAAELSQARRLSVEHFTERLPRILDADPDLFVTPSGLAGLARWIFTSDVDTEQEALVVNRMTQADVDSAKGLAKLDYKNPVKAAKAALANAPVMLRTFGYYSWKALDPEDPYTPRRYKAEVIADAMLSEKGFVYGADGNMYPESEAPKWLKAALKDAEKSQPAVEIEEAAPLDFGAAEVEEMIARVNKSSNSFSVAKYLEEKYELTSADRTYPEDLANAIAALDATGSAWYVGGDRFRKQDDAPEFIYSVPEFFNYTDFNFEDDDGQPIDLELSDDGFSSALRKEMALPIAQDVLDEDAQTKPKKQPDSVRVALKSLHREIGTFPLVQFPKGWFDETPAVQEIVLRDPAGRELSVWVNHETRLMYNLIDWWFEQPIESGAVFTLSKASEPNVFDFAWEEEADPLLFIDSERMEELRNLAANAGELSTYEIIIEVLTKHSKGADFLTILAETNVVRRVTRRLVASILTGYHAFNQRAGSPVWHFDPKKVEQGFDRAKRKFVRE
ncbi:MAG: hypothetical protein M3R13_09865 [Armatimonadota bacterium]|nr:hypothetical protein [Armatimonadota bacterium]